MRILRKNRLAATLNQTALALASEARFHDKAEARELLDLALRLDELRVRLMSPPPAAAEIEAWPARTAA
ncbi:MAG: hypothetical protein OXR84_00690 [Magnetovibrio sp.]|nr:hypothetical protein [Magnetovibrio sp.]